MPPHWDGSVTEQHWCTLLFQMLKWEKINVPTDLWSLGRDYSAYTACAMTKSSFYIMTCQNTELGLKCATILYIQHFNTLMLSLQSFGLADISMYTKDNI